MGTTLGEGRDILQDSHSAFLRYEGEEGVDGMVDWVERNGESGDSRKHRKAPIVSLDFLGGSSLFPAGPGLSINQVQGRVGCHM
jgi:hypothetical protein